MQKHTDEGVILCCDFCGEEWDMVKPMIEGHQGSILCLSCLDSAIDAADSNAEPFKCTLCLRDFEADEMAWASSGATACYDCLQQADKAFDKDPDTDWTRKISPTDRWR
jgi:hypothetical protein